MKQSSVYQWKYEFAQTGIEIIAIEIRIIQKFDHFQKFEIA